MSTDRGKKPKPEKKSGTHFTSECALIVNLCVAFSFTSVRPQMRQTSCEPDVVVLCLYLYIYFLVRVFVLAVGSFVFYRKHNKETSKNKTQANTHRSKEHSGLSGDSDAVANKNQ